METINHKKLMKQNPTLLGATANSKGQSIKFFEHPTMGENANVIGVIDGVAFNTGFYDLLDFGTSSEYNPVLNNDGSVVCEFEATETIEEKAES